jgi:hypothetical protein
LFDLEALVVDTGEQLPSKYWNMRDPDGATDSDSMIPFDPHLPVSRHVVFVGGSEDSVSASSLVGLNYGPAAAVGTIGVKQAIVKDIPITFDSDYRRTNA